jgi:Tol biopolymer transport system component
MKVRRSRFIASGVAAAAALVTAVLVLVPSAPAAYPGPNGLIAFRAVTSDGSSQLFTIDPASLAQVQLTHQTVGDVVSAAHWSPDMSMLTFEVDPYNPTSNDFCHVALLPASGGDPTLLPLANHDQCEAAPTFSADGTRIIYEGFNGKFCRSNRFCASGRDALYSMNLDGSDRRMITACQGRGVTSPEASPDGKLLAFTCGSQDGTALFVSRPDGSGLRQLTHYSMQVGFHEDFSPDSRRIMFITIPNEGTPQAQVNTWTIGVDGSDLEQLTNYPPGGLRALGNSYSPDGQWIVLRIEDGDQSAMFRMKTDGSDLTQMTPYSDFRPRGMTWGSECPCSP